jgi:hypothetical protein
MEVRRSKLKPLNPTTLYPPMRCRRLTPKSQVKEIEVMKSKLTTAIPLVMSLVVIGANGQVTQRQQQEAAKRAYDASVAAHNEVVRDGARLTRDVANVSVNTVLGAPAGPTGAGTGAVRGAIQVYKDREADKAADKKKTQ